MNDGKVCVSVCADSVADLMAKIALADKSADVIEIRIDCLSDAERNLRDPVEMGAMLRQIYSVAHRSQYLTTLRPAEQGGKRRIALEDRLGFWASRDVRGWADFEEDVFSASRPVPDKRICSFHDFSGIPENLAEIYERLRNTGADVVKIVVPADDFHDALSVWGLLQRARTDNTPIIPIAMGEAGKWTRILGLAHGAFMTYASFETGAETAPGQISVGDMFEVFRVKELDRSTGVYGIVAGDTSYSVSPYLHNAAFRARKMNSVFVPLQVRDLDSFFRRAVKPKTREADLNFKGLSVTNPHKVAITGCLDSIDDAARRIGAVNTVKIEDGNLRGFNTDAPGFIEPLRAKLGDLAGSRAAVVGTGGAARACAYALKAQGADVSVLARDEAKAQSLAEEFGLRSAELIEKNGSKAADLSDFEIVVNATPLGTKGERENETLARAEQLKNVKLVYDLVYNPSETRLIREAREAGAETLGGLEMLISQGAKQFEIWTAQEAPVDEMTRAVRKRLNL